MQKSATSVLWVSARTPSAPAEACGYGTCEGAADCRGERRRTPPPIKAPSVRSVPRGLQTRSGLVCRDPAGCPTVPLRSERITFRFLRFTPLCW